MILGENIGSVYSGGKEIQRVYSKGLLVWEKEPIDYSIIPFTVKAVVDDVNVRVIMDKDSGSVKYTFNGVDWNIIDETTDIHLNINDSISIITTNIRGFVIKGLSDVYGNIMSLEYGDNFIGQTRWVGKNVDSYGLFNETDIRSAKNLILPATTLSEGAYRAMFSGCTSLTKAPELPATTLSPYCYHSMFAGCSSLTKAPSLPATKLAEGCYMEMFAGEGGTGIIDPNHKASGLTVAPDLPATTLAPACYHSMFAGCVNLTVAPDLPATKMTESCYEGMFMGCNSLTKAPSLPATTLASGCYRNMFYCCTSLKTAPSLPATTLASGCYPMMFYGCSSLTKAPDLPADKLTAYCYTRMFSKCNNLNYIKCYATSVDSKVNIRDVFGAVVYPDEVWENWTTGVASKGVFVCKSKLATSLKQHIPSTWTVEYFT
jgi:hypothetical protein